jgi:hypothetical protein
LIIAIYHNFEDSENSARQVRKDLSFVYFFL